MPKTEKAKESFKLITLLLSSFVLAMGVVFFLVSRLGASGTVELKDIVVSPHTLREVEFRDKKSPYIFNKIEFVKAEASGKGWGRYAVSLGAYEEFYNKVFSLRSIPQIGDAILTQFQRVAPSTLTLFLQKKEEGEVFQRIEFLDKGDIFRVEYLDADGEEWVYFQYPDIYNEAVTLFVPKSL